MLPKEINNVIQKNLRRIFKDTPTDVILTDLLADRVMSEYEVSFIKRIPDDRDKNFELVKILKKRGQNDFFKFCNALQEHETEHVQELGALLEREAKQALNIKVHNLYAVKQAASTNNSGAGDTVDTKEKLGYDIFLSHSWTNKAHVTMVKDFLQSKGFTCWIDDKQLHGGMELLPELAKAIRESKVFVAFMSKTYIESDNCRKEISYAHDKGKKIIGVIIEDINPRTDLVSSTGIDFLIYISNNLYIKIIVKDPTDVTMKTELEKLATAVQKYR